MGDATISLLNGGRTIQHALPEGNLKLQAFTGSNIAKDIVYSPGIKIEATPVLPRSFDLIAHYR